MPSFPTTHLLWGSSSHKVHQKLRNFAFHVSGCGKHNLLRHEAGDVAVATEQRGKGSTQSYLRFMLGYLPHHKPNDPNGFAANRFFLSQKVVTC